MQRSIEAALRLGAALQEASEYSSWEFFNYVRSRRELTLYGTDRGKVADALLTFRDLRQMTLPWFIRKGVFGWERATQDEEACIVSAHNGEGTRILSITADEVDLRSSGTCRPEADARSDYVADAQELLGLDDADEIFERLGSSCLELHSIYSGHTHLGLSGHTGAGGPVFIHLIGVDYVDFPGPDGLTALRPAGAVELERLRNDPGIRGLFERSTRALIFERGHATGVILASLIGVNWEG